MQNNNTEDNFQNSTTESSNRVYASLLKAALFELVSRFELNNTSDTAIVYALVCLKDLSDRIHLAISSNREYFTLLSPGTKKCLSSFAKLRSLTYVNKFGESTYVTKSILDKCQEAIAEQVFASICKELRTYDRFLTEIETTLIESLSDSDETLELPSEIISQEIIDFGIESLRANEAIQELLPKN
jgi:hypothetical protein